MTAPRHTASPAPASQAFAASPQNKANRRPTALLLVLVLPLVAFASCTKPFPPKTYRIQIENLADTPTSISRRYAIETSSRRTLVLAEPMGHHSTSIGLTGPDRKPTAKAEVTVTATLEDPGPDAQVKIEMVVRTHDVTRSGPRSTETTTTARSEETLAVPGTTNLSAVLTETRPTGDLTTKQTLLRVDSEGKYLEVAIE